MTALTIEAIAARLVLLGMPAMLVVQGRRARRVAVVGYVGIFACVAFFTSS